MARHRSCPTHHSFIPNPIQPHFIPSLLSFSHTSRDYVPTDPNFLHNTSSAHGRHEENCFQDGYSSIACVASHQQPDPTYPSSEITSVLGGQWPYVLCRSKYSASLLMPH